MSVYKKGSSKKYILQPGDRLRFDQKDQALTMTTAGGTQIEFDFEGRKAWYVRMEHVTTQEQFLQFATLMASFLNKKIVARNHEKGTWIAEIQS